ncbi:hypothetical protein L1887_55579 [Cichorium endivia]|nr:hypothetical protein L1887_55579 [Cichorium endivia]
MAVAMAMAVLDSRILRRSPQLLRRRPVQERVLHFHGANVLPRNERQLQDADHRGARDGEPGGAGPAVAVHDTDQRWRDGPRQTAAGHGEAVDFAEDLGRGRGVFEQDECRGVDDDADEALHDERDVNERGSHVLRAGANEGQHQVGDREEDDHGDEGLPDADLLDENGEDDALDQQADGAVDGEVDANVVDCHAEAAEQVEVLHGCFGLVEDPGREQAEVGHGVEGHDDQGDGDHDDGVVEGLAGVFGIRTSAACATARLRPALSDIAADFVGLLGSKADGVHGGEGRFPDVEVLADRSRETFLDERRPGCAASLGAAAHRSTNAGARSEERRGFVKDAGGIVHGSIVGDKLLRVGLLKEEDSLNDGQNNDNNSNKIGQQIRVGGPEAVGRE